MINLFKISFFLILLFKSFSGFADQLSVPENCFNEKKAPCLMHFDKLSSLELDKKTIQIIVSEQALIKWTVFDDVFELDVLKGKIQIKSKNLKTFKINNNLFATKHLFISREADIVKTLKIEDFTLNQYSVLSNSDLKKSEFLSKKDLVDFVSIFFEKSNDLKLFLHTIENSWNKEFNKLAQSQTKVLERSIASAQEQEKIKQQQILQQKEQKKKVRDLLFYRTFYR